MKKLTSFIVLLLLVVACNKQDVNLPQEDQQEPLPVITKRSCASYDVLQSQLQEDPGLTLRMQQVEAYTEKVMNDPSSLRLIGDTIEIPVVVHVLYRTATENISDGQIQSQLTVLNRDYQNKNADRTKLPPGSFQAVASPGLNVRFVLSQTIRKVTKVKSWSTDDAVKKSSSKGDDAVDPTTKLNIWICNLGNGILGYAQFPGGSASTDGVVILYSVFGSKSIFPSGVYTSPYDLGRTATHEVGHWMNLKHIWGDDKGACSGSDLVTDTPNQGAENYGNPTYPHVSCGNTPKGDMFMNYMDYTDDKGMYMFSANQKSRMLALFSGTGQRLNFGKP